MSSPVLIISNSGDIHADAVQALLQEADTDTLRIDLDRFPVDYQFNLKSLGESVTGEVVHIPTAKNINLINLGAIWLRKSGQYSYLDNHMEKQERAFADQETEHALLSILYSQQTYWMSHPAATRSAMWKGEQLYRAAKLGFKVPNTIISNDQAKVRAFIHSTPKQIIFKAMSSPYLGADAVSPKEIQVNALPTTLLTEEMLDSLAAVEQVPCLFQEYVPKSYELRVTVVEDNIFTAKICSQEDKRTSVDCRDMSAEINYSAYSLPAEIAKKCIEFVKSYGLNFGAIDLIVTPDKEYIFLENNPTGQFMYVQQLVPELQILQAVANALARKKIY